MGRLTRRSDRADEAIKALLGKAEAKDPALAQLLRQKYEEERQAFTQAAQEWTPSQEPKYWAKKSCNKCYGRGIIGKRHLFPNKEPAKSGIDEHGNKIYVNSLVKLDVRCSCTRTNYEKWLAEFRLFYNDLKRISAEHALSKAQEQTDGTA